MLVSLRQICYNRRGSPRLGEGKRTGVGCEELIDMTSPMKRIGVETRSKGNLGHSVKMWVLVLRSASPHGQAFSSSGKDLALC